MYMCRYTIGMYVGCTAGLATLQTPNLPHARQVNYGACRSIQTAVLAGWRYQLITGERA